MNATQALGWALVHFLWQGTALAVVLAAVLAITRQTAARTRYALSLATLAAMLVLPIVTAAHLHRMQPPIVPIAGAETGVAQVAAGNDETGTGDAAAVTAVPAPVNRVATISTRVSGIRTLLDPALPWLVVVWVVGVVVFSIRLARGWTSARSLRTHGTTPAPAPIVAMLERLTARLRVRRTVALLQSALIQVPAVVGWLRPVILVPASALTGLTPQQLELLLAHELAHVRRYDYLVNLVQSVVETLLFYHPAVWWVSRGIREERENCCDDLVVRIAGDAYVYATALAGMERLRGEPPNLALAATGGSLLHRVQRLVLPGSRRREISAPWIAGVIAVTVALLGAGGARVATSAPSLSSPITLAEGRRADTTRTASDTVIQHPDPSRPLMQRWEWAHTQARRLDRQVYWIGYRIPRPTWLDHSIYIDRDVSVTGPNVTLSGRMFGDFEGLNFRGSRLASLLDTRDSDDIAMLFGFDGSRLVRVHIASFHLPVDLANRSLFWLGDASDAESVPLAAGLLAATRDAHLREDVVGAVGIHGSSELAVPILVGWMTGREPADFRAQAAEWLGSHPTAAAVNALSRAARGDADPRVRREAAEALGDSAAPAATDSAIAIARTANDVEVRREAVEGLGQKDNDRALAALLAIARDDRVMDVQREAVEALGEMPNGRGLPAVRDLVRTHGHPDVRREAIESLGEHLPAAEAVSLLEAIATSDADSDVRREAVEALGEVHTESAVAVLTRFARTHPDREVRRAAIETLGESGQNDSVIQILEELMRDGDDRDAAREAVETLGEMGDAPSLERVAAIARRHANPEVQREAIETYAENAPTTAAVKLLTEILGGNASEDVYDEVLQSLEELNGGAGIPALIEAARSHPNRQVRIEALRRLGESDDPRAQELLERMLRRP